MTTREASFDHAAEARIDHRRTAEEANREAMSRKGEDSRRWHRKAQVHATLALVEQQRIANLVAYVTHSDGLPDGHKEWLEQEMGL